MFSHLFINLFHFYNYISSLFYFMNTQLIMIFLLFCLTQWLQRFNGGLRTPNERCWNGEGLKFLPLQLMGTFSHFQHNHMLMEAHQPPTRGARVDWIKFCNVYPLYSTRPKGGGQCLQMTNWNNTICIL